MSMPLHSPFPFLDAYGADEHDRFFGREAETAQLYELVYRSPLVLVYGLSGTGKTSLIQCGLASRFDGTDWYPLYVRRGDDLIASLLQTLDQAFPAEATPPTGIVEKIAELYDYYLRPVYLIFDQFEELFILGDEAEREVQQGAFAQMLQDILAAALPCKIMLVMREEYLAHLQPLERVVPTLFDHRLRVEPMGYTKIKAVLTGSFERFNIRLSDATALDSIYRRLRIGEAGVHLPYLQLYLDLLYRTDFAATYPELEQVPIPYPPLEWTPEEIETFGDIKDVLNRFFREREIVLRELLIERFPAAPPWTIQAVFDRLVTEEGTKRPLPVTRNAAGHPVLPAAADDALTDLPAEAVSLILHQLEDARLLRERDGALELAHDSLAARLLTDEQRLRRQLQEQLLSSYRESQLTESYLTEQQLALYEPRLDELTVPAAVRSYVADSRTQHTTAAAQARAREQATHERELAQEQARRARYRRVAVLAGLVAVIALASLAWVWGLSQRTKALSREALRQTTNAQLNAIYNRSSDVNNAWVQRQVLENWVTDQPVPRYYRYLLLGQVVGELGDWSEALAAADSSIRLEPTYFPAYRQRAGAYFYLRQPDSAIVDFRKYLAYDPDPLVLSDIAYCQGFLGDYAQARLTLDTVLERLPAIQGGDVYFQALPASLRNATLTDRLNLNKRELRQLLQEYQETLLTLTTGEVSESVIDLSRSDASYGPALVLVFLMDHHLHHRPLDYAAHWLQALAWVRAGYPDYADAALTRFKEDHNNYADSRYNALATEHTAPLAKAIHHTRRQRPSLPDTDERRYLTAKALQARALEASLTEDYVTASRLMDQARAYYPTEVDFAKTQLQIDFSANYTAAVLDSATVLAERYPQVGFFPMYQALAAYRLYQSDLTQRDLLERARTYIDRARELVPHATDPLYIAYLIYLELGDTATAEQLRKELQALDPLKTYSFLYDQE